MENLGLRLEKAISTCNMEKQRFAYLTGVSKEYVSRIISGKNPMTECFAKKASNVLYVSADYLLGKTDEPYSDLPKDWLLWNRQQYVFLPFEQLLHNMKVNIKWVLYFGKDCYERSEETHYRWIGPAGTFDDTEMDGFIRAQRDNKVRIKYGVVLSSEGCKDCFLEHKAFLAWQKKYIEIIGDGIREILVGYRENKDVIESTTPDMVYRAVKGMPSIGFMHPDVPKKEITE